MHLFLVNNPISLKVACLLVKHKNLKPGEYKLFTTDPNCARISINEMSLTLLPSSTYLSPADWKRTYTHITDSLGSYCGNNAIAYVPHLWNSSHLLLAGHQCVQSYCYIEEGLGSSKTKANMPPHYESHHDISEMSELIRSELIEYTKNFLASNGISVELNPDTNRLIAAYYILPSSFKTIANKKRFAIDVSNEVILVPSRPINAVLLPGIASIGTDIPSLFMPKIAESIISHLNSSDIIILKAHRSTPILWLTSILKYILDYGLLVEEWSYFMSNEFGSSARTEDPCVIQLNSCIIYDSLSALQYMLRYNNYNNLMFFKAPCTHPVRVL